MLSGFLNAKMGASDHAITAFPFQTREAALLVEEIVYLTLEELIKIHRKKHYVIFFKI
jgi:hypothetical protein